MLISRFASKRLGRAKDVPSRGKFKHLTSELDARLRKADWLV